MSNNKQSSVEWFSRESWKLKVKLENKEITIGEYGVTYVDLLKQAKAMHKKEVLYAYMKTLPIEDGVFTAIDKAHEYYNETFGGNK